MEIIGYKCFNKGLINRYGIKFEVGKIYVATGALKFGTDGNGFHLCKNIEDTFSYFDAMNNEVDVCLVKGSGNYIEYSDEDYLEMYCVEKLEIEKKLSREEIIEEGLKLGHIRAERFVSTFSLTPIEIELFKNKFKSDINVLDAISYYQENDKDIYYKRLGLSKIK